MRWAPGHFMPAAPRQAWWIMRSFLGMVQWSMIQPESQHTDEVASTGALCGG